MRTTNRVIGILLAVCSATSAVGQIWYVDKYSPGPTHDGLTWRTAFVDLQDAIPGMAFFR